MPSSTRARASPPPWIRLDLSRKVGHVQFFAVNRAVNHHAWVQIENGQVQRAYAWAGQTLWNQGQMTKSELDLGLKCFDYAEPAEPFHFAHVDPAALNTDRVALLAARWSVDPAAVDVRRLKQSQGITGEMFRFKAH